MTPPEITTARLLMRPVAASDVDALVPIYTDPEVTRFFREPVANRAAVRRMVERRLVRQREPGMGSWVLLLDGQLAGIGHLWPSKELPGSVPEAGWMLHRAHWGRGIATEAATAIITHGLYQLGLPAVWALVHRENKSSLAVTSRLGLLDVGEGEYYGATHRVFVALPVTTGAGWLTPDG